MTYTAWSRGRLLGHTSLGYPPSLPWIRAGDFAPTPIGESLLPVLTGMGPALEALAAVLDANLTDGRAVPGIPNALRRTTEYADVLSLSDQLENLALQLRAPDGAIVPTAAIGIQDSEHLLALARRDGVLADDELRIEPWQPRPPRYQIIVELAGARR